ncbi:MAG TPA: MarR family winged helix-turn-helix transcriptional regulator [Xanthobacteraceae bacterium]|nr:MarR family winged helix-turn-helix transcriptional regulator [Xanthobacteraceae bacterium]
MAEKPPSEAVVRAWTRLVRAQHVALSAVEADLKAAGFPSLGWYDVLLELSRARDGGLRPFELEGRLLLAQYNLSRLLERMQAAGHVGRRPCPQDRRGHLVFITDPGRLLMKRMWPTYRAAIARHVGAKLGEEDAARLAALLGKLIEPAS